MPSLSTITGQSISGMADLTQALVSTLNLSQSINIIGPISSQLDLTHALRILQLPMRMSTDLTLTQLMANLRQYALSHNITITHQMVVSQNNHLDLAHSLSLTDSMTANQTYDFDLASTLALTNTLANQLFPSMYSDIPLTHAIQLKVIRHANTSHGLSISQDLGLDIFRLQRPGQQLQLTQNIGLLRVVNQSIASTLSMTQALVNVNLFVQNLVSTLNLSQFVYDSSGIHVEMCSCIDLTDQMNVPRMLTLTSTLTIDDFLNLNNLFSVLVLSHLLETNAITTRCCDGGGAYIPDKLLRSTLTLTHSIGQSADANKSPESSLALNQSLGYYVVRAP